MLQYISVLIKCFLLTTNLLVLYKICTSWCSNLNCLCVFVLISIIVVHIVTKPILIEKHQSIINVLMVICLLNNWIFLRNSCIFILLNFICSWYYPLHPRYHPTCGFDHSIAQINIVGYLLYLSILPYALSPQPHIMKCRRANYTVVPHNIPHHHVIFPHSSLSTCHLVVVSPIVTPPQPLTHSTCCHLSLCHHLQFTSR